MQSGSTSTSNIKVLPDTLVNKIAAGEVIERPASVVKELVENAIDAGAAHIAVAIEDGGKQLIRVADDGMGMTAADLRLAVTSHATSKIVLEEDLFNVATLGFRGEALPSIGAVSHLRIVSRPKDSIAGAEIIVAAERIESSAAAGSRVGTTVEVRDLFFNVPARRKFLKSNATETGHVNEQVSRLALAHRGIGFELTNNGRTTQKLTGSADIRQRVAALYGPELAEALIAIERSERGLHLEGYVAPPSKSRSTPAGQYILLNGRYIRDKFVQHAVREAYRGLLEPNRYPIVFLFLTVDPGTIDINVHPTKIEVRWQDSNLIHSQVLAALRDKFLSTDLTPALRTDPSVGGAPDRSVEPPGANDVRHQAATFFKSLTPVQPSVGGGGGGAPGPGPEPPPGARTPEEIGPDVWQALYGRHEGATEPEDRPVSGAREIRSALSSAAPGALRRAIQVHNAYLVAETGDGLVIIDQHALHERIMYEKLKAQIVDGPLESQRLLLPETMTVTANQTALLQEHQVLLHQLGIEAEPFGQDTVAVHAFPSILKDVDTLAFLRDLLDRLAVKGQQTGPEEVIHDLLDMMACKAAVKAGDALTPEEIDALLAQKGLVEKSSSCPHGRPTTLRLTINDLEKQFKRK